MVIDPKVEAPLRKMLGHAIRHEMDELAELGATMGDRTYTEGMVLCTLATSYIAIDVCNRWPIDADLRELARRAAKSVTSLPVAEDDIYTYLSRVVFGFEPLMSVFGDLEKTGKVPLYTTANLLLGFHPGEMDQWDYLDQIWNEVEAADRARLTMLPALMYRVRAVAARGK